MFKVPLKTSDLNLVKSLILGLPKKANFPIFAIYAPPSSRF